MERNDWGLWVDFATPNERMMGRRMRQPSAWLRILSVKEVGELTTCHKKLDAATPHDCRTSTAKGAGVEGKLF
ncbi:hypothetical protein PHMEG_00040002 [Phytophthora megakarya]|uniref:Uncharacterized protein n=1 Tax=Phytophthora megakarya TaxID=4795 RepID=A0A225UED4_9STRA|nr:hypothetical protein PHMEG_00040002 [Phytophthora megakarya]